MFDTERNQPMRACATGFRILGPEVRDREGRVDEPHAELERQLVLRIGGEDRADGRRGAAVQPGDRQAPVVEAGLEALDRDGVVEAVVQVVLAGPGDLHGRSAHRLAEETRLDHEVGLRLAAEAAAEKRHVDGDVLLLQPEPFARARARRLRRLHAGPRLALAAADAHERGGRLHGRVGEVRDVVLGLEALRGLGHRGVTSPCSRTTLPGLRAAASSSLAVAVGRVGGVRAVVPGDLQLVAALHRGPGVARDDSDPAERLELGGDRRAARSAQP